jgi:hypothetical protein
MKYFSKSSYNRLKIINENIGYLKIKSFVIPQVAGEDTYKDKGV